MSDIIEIYIGFESPTQADEREGMTRMAGSVGPPRHRLADPDFKWTPWQPRWDHENTSLCAAALLPSQAYDPPLPEGLSRFRVAATRRNEPALIVCELGQYPGAPAPEPAESVWMRLPNQGGNVGGSLLPDGVQILIPDGLPRADRDLALRLRDRREGGPWYALAGPDPSFAGQWLPLLLSDVGETLAATWVPPSEDMRWYVLPYSLPWDSLLSWLESQALPDYVPGALARARRSVERSLLTSAEREAKAHLEVFELQVQEDRKELMSRLENATLAGNKHRYPLLYGSGDDLVHAVEEILATAGFSVENLDHTFGKGRSGDLLISKDGRYWLVEVTSNSGGTSEIEAGKLLGHMETWPALRSELLEGGVLVVNHDYRLPPIQRPSGPYRRPEFIDQLKVRVIGTVSLCKWWAQEDFLAVGTAFESPPGQSDAL